MLTNSYNHEDEEMKKIMPEKTVVTIKNGIVVDGTGAEAEQLDIIVKDGLISAVGRNLPVEGELIDAAGLVVTPGFIDIHTHTDTSIYKYPRSGSRLMQGITTEVTGSCGIGNFPVGKEPAKVEELVHFLKLHDAYIPEEGITWKDFAGFAEDLSRYQLGTNIAPLVGHGALRIAVVGSENRAATSAELEKLCVLLDKQLAQGAWGMSSGLIYPPGSFAPAAEFNALGKIIARHDALYTTHVRGESASLLQAVDEAIDVSRSSNAKVQVSHLKAIGVPNWGNGKKALEKILAARQEGLNVTADQYPYEASATALSVLLPGWVQSGGAEAMVKRLQNAEERKKMLPDLNKEMATRGGPERILITGLRNGREEFVGKKLSEIAVMMKKPADIAVMDLLAEQEGTVQAVYFSISTEDIDYIMQSNIVSIGSDGGSVEIEEAAHSSTHPRFYGTFAKILGTFARDRGLVTLEQAVYKMTGLPAARLGMLDRGIIAVGKAADITIFDYQKIRDLATFEKPHQYSQGIVHVLVNGGFAVKNGHFTNEAHGQVLRKPH